MRNHGVSLLVGLPFGWAVAVSRGREHCCWNGERWWSCVIGKSPIKLHQFENDLPPSSTIGSAGARSSRSLCCCLGCFKFQRVLSGLDRYEHNNDIIDCEHTKSQRGTHFWPAISVSNDANSSHKWIWAQVDLRCSTLWEILRRFGGDPQNGNVSLNIESE